MMLKSCLICHSLQELDIALTSNGEYKWGVAVDLMEKVNHLSGLIRRTPAARKIIPEPKSYSSKLSPMPIP